LPLLPPLLPLLLPPLGAAAAAAALILPPLPPLPLPPLLMPLLLPLLLPPLLPLLLLQLCCGGQSSANNTPPRSVGMRQRRHQSDLQGLSYGSCKCEHLKGPPLLHRLHRLRAAVRQPEVTEAAIGRSTLCKPTQCDGRMKQ